MKRLLFYYSFIVVSMLTVIGFSSAQTPGQLLPAVLSFPLLLYFGLLVIPKRNKAILLPKQQPVKILKGQKIEKAEVTKIKNFDGNRRAFLKIIGSAGITVFLFSIFAKKAEAAFFGSNPGPGIVGIKDSTGTLINPAIKHPTDGYKINQIDDTSSATYSYFGFVNKDGAWFIMRETASGVDVGQYRYTKGTDTPGFSDGWDNKVDPTVGGYPAYNYFDVIFD
ncbi:hypothetical protein A2975_02430 [Candidatus Woesebacteria bacterium RIFCSPLOWO2_01_FULL_44_14]|uniref:Uncharacterized protein n=1 Tax=Candidatus Woesebacteria bacterium RIFCSPLOWO2_01_FULL_44_14 TaxID=1802525 RepID=A0A1F8BYL7_9BACT|nr:MAG: hypothetical protein A2975_02430 [Candidatus Woesebacteria bacterium RIFCSPLOWO2_01_FULL_44_14]